MKLIIVESPGKIRKISSFLPSGYKVLASYGHVRDLPGKALGIEFDDDKVKPKYERLKKSSKYIKALQAAASDADEILLATDPDREGEAIAWHVRALLGPRKHQYQRIVFNEITRGAVLHALEEPRELDLDRVNAQQARRLLDRLVGWGISPYCWERIGPGTSAGRVQSVAVRLVAEREQEIRAFKPETYHELWAWLRPEGMAFDEAAARAMVMEIVAAQRQAGKHPALFDKLPGPPPGAFRSKLIKRDGKKIDHALEDPEEALAYRDGLLLAKWRVLNVEHKERKRRPPPPFITSTLQQAASNRYKLNPKVTMRAAQKLYEAGLITYMRTDAPAISRDAMAMARRFIEANFAPEMLPAKPRYYRAKGSAQEAHECIRPTNIDSLPKDIEARFKGAEGKVYRLIWERFLSSQLPDAIYDDTRVEIEARRTQAEADVDGQPLVSIFEAKGSVVKFKGWTRVGQNFARADAKKDDESSGELPELNADEPLSLARLDVLHKETKPPSRYTQASLIRALEKEGVGRPATYAAIMDTIMARGYVDEKERSLYCTELGEGLVRILSAGFAGHFIELGYTREVEEALDRVAEGQRDWQELVIRFRDEIEKLLAGARKSVEPLQALVNAQRELKGSGKGGKGKAKITREKTELDCPLCSAKLERLSGRYGPWLQCPNHPKCAYKSADLNEKQRELVAPLLATPCFKCGGPMAPKASTKNNQLFMSCLKYPKCDGTAPVPGSEGTVSEGKPARSTSKKKGARKAPRSGKKSPSPSTSLGNSESNQPRSRESAASRGARNTKAAPGQGPAPECPICDAGMVIRTSKRGDFWGCTRFPHCRGTREIS